MAVGGQVIKYQAAQVDSFSSLVPERLLGSKVFTYVISAIEKVCQRSHNLAIFLAQHPNSSVFQVF